jgi:cell division protein FtsI/penicillin-binding protein 2
MRMERHRLFHVLLGICICIVMLSCRLFWLQVTAGVAERSGTDIVAQSVRQRSEGVLLDAGRGHITDRNGERFTGASVEGLLLLPGGEASIPGDTRQRLAKVLRVPEERLLTQWRNTWKPEWWNPSEASNDPQPLTREQVMDIRRLQPPGAVVATKTERYPEERLAAHLVGFIAEQPERVSTLYIKQMEDGLLTLSTPVGASGLELAFDRFLHGHGAKQIVSFTNGRGERLNGLGVRAIEEDNRYYPLQLVTTLDASIQRAVERVLDEANVLEGAVVVLDAATADIVAMASRPTYRTGHLHPNETDWMNRSLAAVAPGSVMKTFIAAVAMEEGVVTPSEMFDCDGTYPKYGLTCWKEGGHGPLTFAEALAESCNLVFAEVGERLSSETLDRYAEGLGLSGKVGWNGESAVDGTRVVQLPEEHASRLFVGDRSEVDGGVLAQTAIGQRDVRWTPLAAANWMVTLLHYGSVVTPRAVTELRYADGHSLERFVPAWKASPLPLSPQTVNNLQTMMSGVVSSGTGVSLRSADWGLAGKSGTAQERTEGHPSVHQWFVGYGPVDLPQYAVAVVLHHRPPESANVATAVFKDVMNALSAHEE